MNADERAAAYKRFEILGDVTVWFIAADTYTSVSSDNGPVDERRTAYPLLPRQL